MMKTVFSFRFSVFGKKNGKKHIFVVPSSGCEPEEIYRTKKPKEIFQVPYLSLGTV